MKYMSSQFINVKDIESEKAKDALLEILRAKADQISNYADFVSRYMQKSGILISTTTKVEWKDNGIDIVIHLEVTAVKKDRIQDLEKHTLRFQRLKEVDTESYEDFNSENENS